MKELILGGCGGGGRDGAVRAKRRGLQGLYASIAHLNSTKGGA